MRPLPNDTIRRWAWLPLPLFLAAVVLLRAMNLQATYEMPWLLFALNLVFSTLVSVFVAGLCARSFLAKAAPGLLLLGCGVLILGLASGWAALIGHGGNRTITVHNLGVLLSSACCLAGMLLTRRVRGEMRQPGWWLVAVYTAGVAAVALIVAAMTAGWLPIFFVEGQGGTPLRQVVLGEGIGMLAVTAAWMLYAQRRSHAAFLYWFGLGLALLATGLLGLLLQESHGGWLGWTGRVAQYTGGVYLLLAGFVAVRDDQSWALIFSDALRDSEERLRLVLEASAMGTFEVELQTGAGRWNTVEFELLGLKPGSVPGNPETFFRYVHPADVGRLKAQWTEALRTGVLDAEFRVVRADGQERWLAGKGRFVFGGAGNREARHFLGVNFDITARKRMEQAALDSSRRWEVLMNALPVGVSYSDDPTCQRITGNPVVLAQFGVKPEDNLSASAQEAGAPGRQISFLHDGRTLTDADLPLQRAVAENREIPPMELEVHLPDGRHWFASASGAPIRDAQGRVLGGVAVTMDITARKQAEERVIRLTRLYAVLSRVNEAIVRIHEKQALFDEVTRIMAEAGQFRLVWIGEAQARVVAPVAAAGAALDYLRDIRVEIDGPLGQEPTGIALREGRPVISDAFNPQAAPAPWRESARRHGIRSSAAFPLRRQAAVFGVLTLYAGASGAFDDEQMQLLEALSNDLSFALDALQHERRRSEADQSLRRTTADLIRSNKELLQFAHVTSHDLKEPLRMVTGFMGLLKDRYQGRIDAKADEYIGFATSAALRMQELIDDLLAYSRVGQERTMGLLDIGEVVAAALSNLRVSIAESGARIHCDPLPTVRANRSEMTQLFQNLIGNALKFRKPGVCPEVHIDACRICAQDAWDGQGPGAERKAAPPPGPRVAVQTPGTAVGDAPHRARRAMVKHGTPDPGSSVWRFTVRDNGIGIAPQYHDRLFAIFQRLHTTEAYPGTGVGLAICKKIMEQHGGRIWVESAEGEGCTFYFTLPETERNS